MTLRLPSAFAVSATGHLLLFLALALLGRMYARLTPRVIEITLVAGPGAPGGTQGAAVVNAAPGGRKGTALVKPVRKVTRGQVSIATPEFVPVGRRPKRTGEELMGTEGGEGGGVAAPDQIGTPGAGGAGRLVRYQEPLEYPDWAKEQGIDARVVLRFKVLPGGAVDGNIIVVRTAGWRQLDELAIKSLRLYLFQPLPTDAVQVAQWGELTFHFKPE